MATSSVINSSATGALTIALGTVSVTLDSANTPVEIANDLGNPVPINSNRTVIYSETIRPNDVTAYTAKDVIANSNTSPVIGTLTNAARIVGGSGNIVKLRLMTDQKTCIARMRTHFFHTAPTMIPDNSPYTLLYTNGSYRVGSIDFPAFSTEDSANSTAAFAMRPSTDGAYSVPNLAFTTGSSRDLYYIHETLDGFTPAANQKFYLEVTIDQN